MLNTWGNVETWAVICLRPPFPPSPTGHDAEWSINLAMRQVGPTLISHFINANSLSPWLYKPFVFPLPIVNTFRCRKTCTSIHPSSSSHSHDRIRYPRNRCSARPIAGRVSRTARVPMLASHCPSRSKRRRLGPFQAAVLEWTGKWASAAKDTVFITPWGGRAPFPSRPLRPQPEIPYLAHMWPVSTEADPGTTSSLTGKPIPDPSISPRVIVKVSYDMTGV